MKKIKVGDKIRVISKENEGWGYEDLVGNEYIVDYIWTESNTGYECASLIGTPYSPYLFNCELVNKKQFTKSDLKSGDIVELRNGNRYILIKDAKYNKYKEPIDTFEGVDLISSIYLDAYSDNLLYLQGDKSYDIMKISDSFYIANIFRESPSKPLKTPDWIWEREETEEMTLEEVCQELGRNIKIVKEH